MSWKTVELGDICEFIRGLTYSKVDEVEFSNNAVLRATNIDLESNKLNLEEIRYINSSVKIKEEKKVKLNDILICTASGSKSHLGKVALINEQLDMAFGGFMAVLRVKNIIEAKFLFNYLTSDIFLNHVSRLADGANINNLKFSQIQNLKINLPSLATQQKIVAKLDAIFAEIDTATAAAEANAKNAEALFQSYLSKIIERNSENSKVVKLGMICEIARGGSPRPIDKFITDDKDGINWIKIGDATRSKKYIFETREKIIKDGVSRSRLVKDGDFLLSNSMSYGRPYIMRTTGCIHDGWLVLSKYQEFLDIDYFYFLLSSAIVVKQFDNLAQGSTVSNLNKELVSRVEVKLPSLSNQKLIVSKLNLLTDNVDIVKNSYINKIRELLKFKQSILQRAFSGELVKD